jgi:hypothetical protein
MGEQRVGNAFPSRKRRCARREHRHRGGVFREGKPRAGLGARLGRAGLVTTCAAGNRPWQARAWARSGGGVGVARSFDRCLPIAAREGPTRPGPCARDSRTQGRTGRGADRELGERHSHGRRARAREGAPHESGRSERRRSSADGRTLRDGNAAADARRIPSPTNPSEDQGVPDTSRTGADAGRDTPPQGSLRALVARARPAARRRGDGAEVARSACRRWSYGFPAMTFSLGLSTSEMTLAEMVAQRDPSGASLRRRGATLRAGECRRFRIRRGRASRTTCRSTLDTRVRSGNS